MSQPNLRAAYTLSALAAVAMGAVAAAGVVASEALYRDNPLITATFRGQDLVTVLVAVPALLVGLVLELKGSARGRIVWLGMLFYAMYGYLFYAVGAAFNVFFLLYVAIWGLGTYALVFSAPRIDLDALGATMGGTLARGVAIAYMLVVTAGLGLLWIGLAGSYLFTHAVPGPIVTSGHPTGVVFAIDLVYIVPPMLMGAIALIRRRAIGWVIAGVMAVNGTVYTLSLAVASIEVARSGVGSGGELPIWVALTVLGAVTAGLLLAGTKPSESAASSGPR